MSERAHEAIPITVLRVGRTDVGAATASIEDETLTIFVRIDDEDKALRLRFSTIDVVQVTGDEVDIVVRDGRHVTFAAPGELREQLMSRTRALPELTRTLRAFGSSRARRTAPGGRTTDATEQQRFFAPFLDARRAADTADGAITAFNGSKLTTALNDTLKQFAADRQPEPGPARRALEAELVDASEPLFDALTALRESADVAVAAADDLRLWRVWSVQLRVTFETADRVWMSLDEALDIAHRHSVVEEARKGKPSRKAR
ncbi:MAG TPA: hypothetical protein VGM82_18345 [Gemmatimonadaceae bacterium]|jgi:hypothetical protein